MISCALKAAFPCPFAMSRRSESPAPGAVNPYESGWDAPQESKSGTRANPAKVDDFGYLQSQVMNVIVSNKLEEISCENRSPLFRIRLWRSDEPFSGGSVQAQFSW